MEWPEYFPPSCPPVTAKKASGKVYRFIDKKHKSPQDKDFLSWKEEHPNEVIQGKECQSCGLSIYISLEEAKRVARLIPKLRKMKIAEGNLVKDSGKIENTPSCNSKDHFTWWIPKNLPKPCNLFYIIE